jgi:hypothetical protein
VEEKGGGGEERGEVRGERREKIDQPCTMY